MFLCMIKDQWLTWTCRLPRMCVNPMTNSISFYACASKQLFNNTCLSHRQLHPINTASKIQRTQLHDSLPLWQWLKIRAMTRTTIEPSFFMMHYLSLFLCLPVIINHRNTTLISDLSYAYCYLHLLKSAKLQLILMPLYLSGKSLLFHIDFDG